MTPEQKAEISRRNGAKSRGPVSTEGKLHSSRNAIRYGKYTENLKYFLPPQEARETNETRQAYFSLLDTLIEVYRPVDDIGYNITREIAVATWQFRRLTAAHMVLLSRECDRLMALISAGDQKTLSGDGFPSPRLTREIDRLHARIARLERRLALHNKSLTTKSKSIHQQTLPGEMAA